MPETVTISATSIVLENITTEHTNSSIDICETLHYYYDYEEFFANNCTVEYEVDFSITSIPLKDILPLMLFYSLTLLMGIVGNVLVIFSVSYYRRMRTVTNSFL